MYLSHWHSADVLGQHSEEVLCWYFPEQLRWHSMEWSHGDIICETTINLMWNDGR
jgi:hypothetical protein